MSEKLDNLVLLLILDVITLKIKNIMKIVNMCYTLCNIKQIDSNILDSNYIKRITRKRLK